MQLTEELRATLIAQYRSDPTNNAFLVWLNPYDPSTLVIKGCKWKGKAYEERQELWEDGIPKEDILIMDIVDLNVI